MEETNIRFEDLPEAVQWIKNKLTEIALKIDRMHGNAIEKEEPPQWFSIQELCDYLPEHPAIQTVYTWTSANRIPYYKEGKRIRFLKSEIDKWMLNSKLKSRDEQGEIPYGALEKFGLSHEMIEDLPMHVLEDIWNGRQSPVLPIHVTDDEGELIKSRTRFSLVRMEDGKVDVMFYPVLKYALLEQFDDNQQQLLKDGKAVVADVTSPQGTIIKAFVQIDPETNQVMNVPTPVIGRNLQVLSEELGLGSAEIKTMQNGQPLTFVIDDEPVTVGIDLNSNTGIRFAQGDEQQWKERGKREWDKFTFGCYGCWVTDDEGNHDYVVEDEYTEELWNEQKKSAQRNASLRK